MSEIHLSPKNVTYGTKINWHYADATRRTIAGFDGEYIFPDSGGVITKWHESERGEVRGPDLHHVTEYRKFADPDADGNWVDLYQTTTIDGTTACTGTNATRASYVQNNGYFTYNGVGVQFNRYDKATQETKYGKKCKKLEKQTDIIPTVLNGKLCGKYAQVSYGKSYQGEILTTRHAGGYDFNKTRGNKFATERIYSATNGGLLYCPHADEYKVDDKVRAKIYAKKIVLRHHTYIQLMGNDAKAMGADVPITDIVFPIRRDQSFDKHTKFVNRQRTTYASHNGVALFQQTRFIDASEEVITAQSVGDQWEQWNIRDAHPRFRTTIDPVIRALSRAKYFGWEGQVLKDGGRIQIPLKEDNVNMEQWEHPGHVKTYGTRPRQDSIAYTFSSRNDNEQEYWDVLRSCRAEVGALSLTPYWDDQENLHIHITKSDYNGGFVSKLENGNLSHYDVTATDLIPAQVFGYSSVVSSLSFVPKHAISGHKKTNLVEAKFRQLDNVRVWSTKFTKATSSRTIYKYPNTITETDAFDCFSYSDRKGVVYYNTISVGELTKDILSAHIVRNTDSETKIQSAKYTAVETEQETSQYQGSYVKEAFNNTQLFNYVNRLQGQVTEVSYKATLSRFQSKEYDVPTATITQEKVTLVPDAYKTSPERYDKYYSFGNNHPYTIVCNAKHENVDGVGLMNPIHVGVNFEYATELKEIPTHKYGAKEPVWITKKFSRFEDFANKSNNLSIRVASNNAVKTVEETTHYIDMNRWISTSENAVDYHGTRDGNEPVSEFNLKHNLQTYIEDGDYDNLVDAYVRYGNFDSPYRKSVVTPSKAQKVLKKFNK